MTKSHIFIAAILLVSGICSADIAFAGQVQIVAKRNFCNLEVREGKSNNPEANRQIYSGPVQPEWSHTGDEGDYVCYRREGNPGVCPSGMSNWTCNSNSTSGVDSYDIH